MDKVIKGTPNSLFIRRLPITLVLVRFLASMAVMFIMMVRVYALSVSVPSVTTVSSSQTTTLSSYTIRLTDTSNNIMTEAEACLVPNLAINGTSVTSWGTSIHGLQSIQVTTGTITNNCNQSFSVVISANYVILPSLYAMLVPEGTYPAVSTCEIDIPSTISFGSITADAISTSTLMQSTGQCDNTFNLTFTGTSDGEYFKLGDYLGASLTWDGTIVQPGVAFQPSTEQSYSWSLYPLNDSVPAGTYSTAITVQLDME